MNSGDSGPLNSHSNSPDPMVRACPALFLRSLWAGVPHHIYKALYGAGQNWGVGKKGGGMGQDSAFVPLSRVPQMSDGGSSASRPSINVVPRTSSR